MLHRRSLLLAVSMFSALIVLLLAVPSRSYPNRALSPQTASKGSGYKTLDKVYQQLRQGSDTFNGEYATVTNLTLKRDAGTFTLQSGEIYFLPPVEGRTLVGVFIGSGDFELAPPTEIERNNLTIFTDSPGLRESFSQLVLTFTDKTYEEIKSSPSAKMGTNGTQAGKARELYLDKRDVWRKTFNENWELRALMDLYGPDRPGVFNAFIGGRRFNKLVYSMDPLGQGSLSPEQVLLVSYGDSDGGVWSAFQLAGEYHEGVASYATDRRQFDQTKHVMDISIKGTRMTMTDKMDYVPRVAGERVLHFDLFEKLRVSAVKNAAGQSLDFIQEDQDEDSEFAVILPEAGEVGKSYQLTVEFSGDGALKDSGGGNFILGPRETWFPSNPRSSSGDRALFDLTFHYPKGNILVGVGSQVEPEKTEGESKTAHWTTGQTEVAVAGFNYGKFVKKDVVDPDTGLGIEFYANLEPPDEFKDFQLLVEAAKKRAYPYSIDINVDVISPASMGKAALADTQNSTRLYTDFFGKLPYSRIAMTQQPEGFFGQAWPTLVFMPYLAFIDGTQRVQIFGVRGGTDSFWTYVAPHEVSHQWWGHAVGWKSYRDQWMSEGFAEFSTSLYAQYIRKDIAKFTTLWEEQRKKITQATELTKNKKPYTVGPISLGTRLSNAKTGATYNFLVYPKGAYVLHMIRMMMFDPRDANGADARFKEMMHDFVSTYYNQDVTTEDFKHVVEKHMTKAMDVAKNHTMDWFFNEWVNGTDVPEYKFDYKLGQTEDGKTTISGRVTQSGVSKNFAMNVPIYVDFGSGWGRLGAVTLVGNSSFDLPPVKLPQAPKKVTLCAMNDVLYTNLEVNKH